MFLGLRTVIYPAKDLAEAKAWYEKLLGFPPYFDEPFYVDPTLIARGCKSCATVGFFTRVVVFGDADGRFLHLVSHCSAS